MTTPTSNLFASHHQKILNPSWMNWASECFICRVLPGLRIFTVTNTVHNFVVILYSMKSPESNYLCFFFFSGNLRRKALLVVTADNLTLLPTFRACTGCITEVKVLFVILCFVYIYILFILLLLLLLLLSFSLFLLQNVVIWR